MTSPSPPVEVPAALAEESSDHGSTKSAWKSVNGLVGAPPVIGGAAWPTISESTRLSPKSLSNYSKPLSDGGSISVSQEQPISHAPHKQQATANGNLNSSPSHKQPYRQRSMKKGSSAGVGSGQSGFSRPPPPPPPPPPFPIHFGNVLPPVMEFPIREPSPYRGGSGPHSHDHSAQRHVSRRANFGSRPRGDSAYNNGYARRDQDSEWNGSRNSSAREVHMIAPPPPPPPPQGLTRPALPGSIPFIPPPLQHVRPFANPMPYDMVPPFLFVPPMPPVAIPPPLPMFYPVIDPNIRTLLLNQIDYYFSDANLVKDDFLRSNMDDQGWVPISLIASFRRVSKLTSNIDLILDTLGASTIVEVQGDKIRRRDNWSKWIPSVGQPSPHSGSESTDAVLATSIQEVQLDEATANKISTTDNKVERPNSEREGVSSETSTAQPELANGEESTEASSYQGNYHN